MEWVRLPGLPLMYYDDDLLATFAQRIGKPVKIDSNTSLASRELYARMCVEIDLTQPLVPLVTIRDEVSMCNMRTFMSFGMVSDIVDVPRVSPPSQPKQPATFGEWMVVAR
ncbi:hypothetical protein Tsubulata_000022 [Turnera subulata]|uniref:DUF4283 domain-containing protein n=1 Tax=Turnera subulata TaxID=218843 RepID=A0A9Q0FJ90_9ROSI|nr:hypothetical protein Tsubulata_000022 [Turnera subulata]